MATILTTTYSANTAIALDLSSLGTSSTWVAGQQSDQIDNTSTMYDDCLVNVGGITGHASTAPTVGTVIGIWVFGANTSLGTTAIDVLTGSTAARTLGHQQVLNSLRLAGTGVVTVNTAALKYWVMPFSVASLFGGVMPKYWGLFVAHNQAGALGASNNSLFSFNGITYTST
jgi:hypothetical protein